MRLALFIRYADDDTLLYFIFAETFHAGDRLIRCHFDALAIRFYDTKLFILPLAAADADAVRVERRMTDIEMYLFSP